MAHLSLPILFHTQNDVGARVIDLQLRVEGR